MLKRIIGKSLERQVKGILPSDTKFALEKSSDPEILRSLSTQLDHPYITESLHGLTVLEISPSYLASYSEDALFCLPYPKPHLGKLCKILSETSFCG